MTLPYADNEQRLEYLRAYSKRRYADTADRESKLAGQRNAYTPEKKTAKRDYRLKKFGITEDDYARILERQDGKCAICRRLPEETGTGNRWRKLAVDHCHFTGVVRGLLYYTCNVALGMFGEDIDRITAAIKYLRSNGR